MSDSIWKQMCLPQELQTLLRSCKDVDIPNSRAQILKMAMGDDADAEVYEVGYQVPGKGLVSEATVTRCKNGLSANYIQPYMRRRDPDCMVVADDKPSDKQRFEERFKKPFEPLRRETLDWLGKQRVVLLPLYTGGKKYGYPTLLVAPRNAGFFVGALADLQEMIPADELPDDFTPMAIIYLAPPFRHTHFDRKQVVVHNRGEKLHEIFAYNLYPGPSAKKGTYGVLIHQGEKEGWITAHCSTVQVVTPYDNILTLMHEGASGGGKSEMLEPAHRGPDGRLMVGRNIITGERRYLSLPRACQLRPVSDDMALCHRSLRNKEGKLGLVDAENAWFLRFNHITHYGTDAYWEKICCHPEDSLLFLNMDGKAGATCLIWEHIEDEPGVSCPNPRVVMPRRLVPDVVNDSVMVDVRSFGVRTPPCTREQPSYGIIGLLHLLPPALAWLWRLVAPRGHANPSITASDVMSSEGVGSFWPFATGRRVVQANLLLDQIVTTPRTRYVLMPNQYIGVWECGFMPQWLAREYLGRRGSARFRSDQITPARCALLGYAMDSMQVEGTTLPHWFLEVESQPEVGVEGYTRGAEQLNQFFRQELSKFLEDDLDPLGTRIIQCAMDGGSVTEYEGLISSEPFAPSA